MITQEMKYPYNFIFHIIVKIQPHFVFVLITFIALLISCSFSFFNAEYQNHCLRIQLSYWELIPSSNSKSQREGNLSMCIIHLLIFYTDINVYVFYTFDLLTSIRYKALIAFTKKPYNKIDKKKLVTENY